MRFVIGSNPDINFVWFPEVDTKYSFMDKWIETSDGNIKAADRGSDSDVYECVGRMYGTQSYIENILDEIETARQAGTNSFTIDEFVTPGQEIFGADIDYSSGLTVSIVDTVPLVSQGSFKGFGVQIRLRAISPTFTGSASIPTLRPLIGYQYGVNDTLNRLDTYDGTFSYLDRNSDTGVFTADYEFSRASMISLRRYIATQRGGSWSISDLAGVDNPFGHRSSSYPYTCKLISFIDRGQLYPDWWSCSMTFREVV